MSRAAYIIRTQLAGEPEESGTIIACIDLDTAELVYQALARTRRNGDTVRLIELRAGNERTIRTAEPVPEYR